MTRRGEQNTRARLTDDEVRAIKRALARGATLRALAKEYGVSHQLIHLIDHGRTRSWIAV